MRQHPSWGDMLGPQARNWPQEQLQRFMVENAVIVNVVTFIHDTDVRERLHTGCHRDRISQSIQLTCLESGGVF